MKLVEKIWGSIGVEVANGVVLLTIWYVLAQNTAINFFLSNPLDVKKVIVDRWAEIMDPIIMTISQSIIILSISLMMQLPLLYLSLNNKFIARSMRIYQKMERILPILFIANGLVLLISGDFAFRATLIIGQIYTMSMIDQVRAEISWQFDYFKRLKMSGYNIFMTVVLPGTLFLSNSKYVIELWLKQLSLIIIAEFFVSNGGVSSFISRNIALYNSSIVMAVIILYVCTVLTMKEVFIQCTVRINRLLYT